MYYPKYLCNVIKKIVCEFIYRYYLLQCSETGIFFLIVNVTICWNKKLMFSVTFVNKMTMFKYTLSLDMNY